MSNPLANPLLTKARLEVPVSQGNVVQDDDGNWVTDGDTIAEYSVYFKKPGRQPETDNNSGVDGYSVYLKGYLVEPKFLPPNIKLPMTVDCIRYIGQREQKCTFEIRPSIVPVELVEEIIGQAIEGWLRWS